LVAACAALLGGGQAAAHDPGLSALVVRIEGASLDVTLRLNRADLMGIEAAPGVLTPATAAGALAVALDGHPIAADRVEVATEPPHLVIRGRYRGAGAQLGVRSVWLDRLPFGHRQLVRVESADGTLVLERLLSAASPSIDATIAPHPAAGAARAFFTLGIAHILGGWDHLVFLLTLLVACSGLGAILRTVSVFTLAHSLTLAAATLGWARLSPTLVEPAIAASIVAAAGLNLAGAVPGRERLALTFGFGLVHGLGFAGALTELGLGASLLAVLRSLVAFNAGVETGQLAVVACALPLLWMLRRSPAYARYGIPACSLAAASIGVGWLLERTAG
jgi:hypothetical protein